MLFSVNITAQIADFKFLFDTVCVNEEVTIVNNSPGAGSYQWIFESADISQNSDISEVPQVTIPNGITPDTRGPYFLASIKVGENIYTFTTKHAAPNALYRQGFGNTFDNIPSNDFVIGEETVGLLNGEHIEGVEIEQDDNGNYYGFLVSELYRCIYRLDFGTDIESTPTIEKLDFPESTNTGHDIELVKEGSMWYGFVSYSRTSGGLMILRFMDGLGGDRETIFSEFHSPASLGLSSADGMTGLGVIKDNNTWHVFGSVNQNNKLVRIDFAQDLTFIDSYSYGTVGGIINEPRDISVAYDCGYLTGFVVNEGNQSLAIVHFGTPTAENVTGEQIDLSAFITNPRSLSSVYRIGGEAMVIIVDRDSGKLIRLKFSPNGNHLNMPYPANDDFEPWPLSYNTVGNYYVSLGLDADLSTTYCKGVTIIDKPTTPVISNTQICEGGILYLDSYDFPNIRYEWTLPDNSKFYGQYPTVNLPGTYRVKMRYGGCESEELSSDISVLQTPDAEIVPDSVFVCENKNFEISAVQSGGTPPYNSNEWTGDASNFISSLYNDTTIYNGTAQIVDDTVFLSDLSWVSAVSEGGMPFLDRSAQNTTINLNGFEYEKGLGVAAYSDITYDLNGQYKWFIAEAGLQNNGSECGSVIFRVYTDGLIRQSSDIMYYYSPKDMFIINVNNRNSLRLVVETTVDGNTCDIANWANARLVGTKLVTTQNLIYRTTDSQGCNGYDTIDVVLDTTTIRIHTSIIDTIACETQKLDFPVVATGKGNLSYQWQKRFGATWTDIFDDSRITGTDTSVLHFDSITIDDIGVFRCHIVSDDCGDSYTDAYRIQVYTSPIITSSYSSIVCGSGSVILNAFSNKGSVRWYSTFEGGNYIDETTAFFVPYLDYAATYYAEAFYYGCPSLERAPVLVDYVSPVPVDSFSIVDATLCNSFDGSLTFNVQGNVADYQFSIDSGLTWQTSPFFTGLEAKYYYPFTMYDTSTCKFAVEPVQVPAIQSPVFDGVTPTPISNCKTIDGSIDISASGGTGNFLYSINNGDSWDTTSTYTGLEKNVYTVIVKNDDGSCETPYHSPVIVSGPEQIEFLSIDSIDLPYCITNEGAIIIFAIGDFATLQYSIDSGSTWTYNNAFSGLTDGQYNVSVRYETGQCERQYGNTITLERPPTPVIDTVLTSPQTSFDNPDGRATVRPVSGGRPVKYSINNRIFWLENDSVFNYLERGDYTVIISNADNSCEGTPVDFKIETAWKDTIYIDVCNNEGSYNLNNPVSHFGIELVWYDSQENEINEGLIEKQDYNSGKYSFVGMSLNDTIKLALTFYDKKDAGIDQTLPMFCDPQVNFFNVTEISDFLIEGYLISEDGDSIYADNYLISEDYINLKLIMPGDNICPSDTAEIAVQKDNTKPDITCDTEVKRFTIPAGLEYFPIEEDILVPTVSDDCSWTIKNDITDNESLLGARLDVGQINIKWTATDLSENSSDCYSVIVIKEFEVPNIFTPNYDGYNDVWDFSIEKELPNAEIFVYNRGGKLLYKSEKGYIDKWDGKGPNNEILPSGAYLYIIKNNEEAIFKGTVTILR